MKIINFYVGLIMLSVICFMFYFATASKFFLYLNIIVLICLFLTFIFDLIYYLSKRKIKQQIKKTNNFYKTGNIINVDGKLYNVNYYKKLNYPRDKKGKYIKRS